MSGEPGADGKGGVTPLRLRRALDETALAGRLDDDEIKWLASLCSEQQHAPGDTVLREGESSSRLFLIESGRVDVVKSEDAHPEGFTIGHLGPGELFGDMSFLDGRTASATIRVEKPTRLLSFSRESLEGGDAHQRDAYETILRALASVNVERLRVQNDARVASLRSELETARLKNEAAQFLILVVLVFGVQNFTGVLILGLDIDTNHPLYEWGLLLTFLVPTVYFARRFGYSLASMGITSRNWKRALLESALIAPLLVGGAILAKWLLWRTGVMEDDGAFFSSRLLDERPWEFVVYLAHAGLQELGSRGIFQGSLHRFFGRGKGKRAVWVISLMFGILHLHLGMAMVGIAFFGSLFFGFLYLRHRTLLGVVLLHYLTGIVVQLMGFM